MRGTSATTIRAAPVCQGSALGPVPT
jgi:hypothetical protein